MEIRSASDLVRMTRGAIAAAGFVRHEGDGLVWWESPGPDGTNGTNGTHGTNGTNGQTSTPISPIGPIGPIGPIVLLHGANDHAGTWFTVAPALARDHRVILPDLPGHGESAPSTGPIPLSLILSKLETLLAAEESFTLVGNSLGGWLALHYALRHPDQLHHLVLEASGGLNRPLSAPLVARDRDEARLILRAVHGPKFVPPEWVIEALLQRATNSPMLRLTEVPEHDIEARLGEIRTPATLIWGADDGVLPLDYAYALQQFLPGSRLEVIEGAGHIPHMQQPERYLACLTAIS